MLNFNHFKVLTFDCYGTLIDWETGILSTLRMILANHYIVLSDERILKTYAELEAQLEKGIFQNYKSILKCIVEGFGKKFGFEAGEFEKIYLVESLKSWQPFPDTVDALKTLKKRFKLGIISNIDNDLFSYTEKHLQISFDWIITSEYVGSYKPSLNNFIKAIEIIGIPKNEILHIGQSIYHDIAPAKKLGLTTVWINRHYGEKSPYGATPPAEAEPDLEVPNLKKLVEKMKI